MAWGTECKATHKVMGHLQSDNKEADRKIILHALDASADGATELTIHSHRAVFRNVTQHLICHWAGRKSSVH